MASLQFKNLAPKTKKELERQKNTICSAKLRGGREFGDLKVHEITPVVIRNYLDKRGKTAPVMANREVSSISMAYSWGRERFNTIKVNPCIVITKLSESPR